MSGNNPASDSNIGAQTLLYGALADLLPDLAVCIYSSNNDFQNTLSETVAEITGLPNPGAPDIIALSTSQKQLLRLQLAKLVSQQNSLNSIVEFKQYVDSVNKSKTHLRSSLEQIQIFGAPIISMLVLVCFAMVLYLALTRNIPAGSETMLNIMIGTLGTMSVQVVSYWVGSSIDSRNKNQNTPPTPPNSQQMSPKSGPINLSKPT